MLHWLFLLSYLILCALLSLFFVNKNFLHIIFLGEILLLFLFFIGLIIAGVFNLYVNASFALLLLTFGSLELSLNILLFLY